MHDGFKANENLQKIIGDKFSGSTDLLVNLISYFSDSPEDLKDKNLLEYLKNVFSPFQTIRDFLLRSEKYSSASKVEIAEFLRNEREHIFEEIISLFNKSRKIFENKNQLTTISNSFFLRNFFILLNDEFGNVAVSVSESRPLFEGRILAKSLAEKNINVNLFTEAQTPEFVERCDAVVIGADKILSDNSVVNKAGSRNLAIAAKYFNKPFYVLASKSKFSNSTDFDEGFHEKSEIFDDESNEMISVTNRYFEKIESSLITAILHI